MAIDDAHQNGVETSEFNFDNRSILHNFSQACTYLVTAPEKILSIMREDIAGGKKT